MTTDNLTQILDIAVTRWQNHEPLDDLIRMSDTEQVEALQPLLAVVETLDLIRPVQMPTEEAIVNDRNAFLGEIAHWQLQAVSLTRLGRLKEWITNYRSRLGHRSPWLRKEKPLMNSILAKFIVIFVLAFVAIGGTAAAAAGSLPDSTLYPVKLVMEDTQLALTQDPAQTVDLYLTFAQERVQEMTQMALNGADPGEATVLRLENHLQNAMAQSAQLSDNTALLTLLEQMQQTVQNQSQMLAQAQLNVSTQTQNRLLQAQTICNLVLAEVETGLQDPTLFRERHTRNRPEAAPPQPEMTPRPNNNGTPVNNQHSYGPGDGTPNCADCTPTGNAHQYGPQPTQPGPGQPGGNPNATPQPTGTAHQNGPQPTQPGPGQPGGNPNATPQPTGTAHQNGPQPTQPGPGQPGGNPNATPQPTGTAHQNGPQPTQPGPGQPGGNPNATPQATCTAVPQGTQAAPSGPNGSGGNPGH